MKKYVTYFICLIIISCAGNNISYSDELQPWIGQSEERLFQSWGYPRNSFYVTPQEKVITYLHFSKHPQGYQPYSNIIAYSAIATPDIGLSDQPRYSTYYCKTSFTIINGIISNFSFNGDACVADSRGDYGWGL